MAAHIPTGSLRVGNGGAAGSEVQFFDRLVSDARCDNMTVYLRTGSGFAPPMSAFAWYDSADSAAVITAGKTRPGSVATGRSARGSAPCPAQQIPQSSG
jgi:hypothetical protein